MRLKYKMLLAMLICCGFLVVSQSVLTLSTFKDFMFKKEFSIYSDMTDQMLLSFTYISDNVESYLFNICKTEGVANIITLENRLLNRETQLRLKLNNAVINSLYIEDAFVVDISNQFYFSRYSDEAGADVYRQVYAAAFADSDRDFYWAKGVDGNVYMRRAIYNLAPYEKVAYIVARIDKQYIRSLISAKDNLWGEVFLLNFNGDDILSINSVEDEKETEYDISQLSAVYLANEGGWQEAVWRGERIYMYKTATPQADWSAVYVAYQNSMLTEYYAALKTDIMISIGLIVMAAIMSLFFSKNLTDKITCLIEELNHVHDGTMTYRLPEGGRDEVTDLTRKFNWLLNRVDESYSAILEANTARQEARYQLLDLKFRFIQAQISPHFFSNILCNISSLTLLGEAEKAERLCVRTSQYLKSSLWNADRKFNPVMDEINTAVEYIDIYQSINATPLRIDYSCPEELQECIIPCATLQPLVENIVMHAMTCGDGREYYIKIDISCDKERLIICVEDNGCGIADDMLDKIERMKWENGIKKDHNGFGLYGTISRFRLLYERDYGFRIETKLGVGTKIFISVPIRY